MNWRMYINISCLEYCILELLFLVKYIIDSLQTFHFKSCRTKSKLHPHKRKKIILTIFWNSAKREIRPGKRRKKALDLIRSPSDFYWTHFFICKHTETKCPAELHTDWHNSDIVRSIKGCILRNRLLKRKMSRMV